MGGEPLLWRRWRDWSRLSSCGTTLCLSCGRGLELPLVEVRVQAGAGVLGDDNVRPRGVEIVSVIERVSKNFLVSLPMDVCVVDGHETAHTRLVEQNALEIGYVVET